jgi:hypothetical protein
VTKAERPLRGAEDVDGLQLGPKTSEKLKEILATGSLARNRLQEADPRHQVRALLCSAAVRGAWHRPLCVCNVWLCCVGALCVLCVSGGSRSGLARLQLRVASARVTIPGRHSASPGRRVQLSCSRP